MPWGLWPHPMQQAGVTGSHSAQRWACGRHHAHGWTCGPLQANLCRLCGGPPCQRRPQQPRHPRGAEFQQPPAAWRSPLACSAHHMLAGCASGCGIQGQETWVPGHMWDEDTPEAQKSGVGRLTTGFRGLSMVPGNNYIDGCCVRCRRCTGVRRRRSSQLRRWHPASHLTAAPRYHCSGVEGVRSDF